MKWFLPILLALASGAADARTWTSTSGTTLEAEFVEIKNNTVTLRKEDGKTVNVGIQFFSQADRDYINQQKPEVEAKNGASNGSPASAFGSTGATRKDLLTDEQVAALKAEIAGKKENVKYVFMSNFQQRRLDPKELRRLKDGQIPIRLTVEFLELTTANGKTTSKRMPGYVRFYIKDSEGNVLVSKRQALESMCPT